MRDLTRLGKQSQNAQLTHVVLSTYACNLPGNIHHIISLLRSGIDSLQKLF